MRYTGVERQPVQRILALSGCDRLAWVYVGQVLFGLRVAMAQAALAAAPERSFIAGW